MSVLICATSRCHISHDSRMIARKCFVFFGFFFYFVCIKWDNSFWGSFFQKGDGKGGEGSLGKESDAPEQVHNDNLSVSLNSSTELYIDKHWLMGPGTSHCIRCVCRLCVNSTPVCLFREVYWFLMTNLRIQCSIFFLKATPSCKPSFSIYRSFCGGLLEFS